jgi:hypothetical protein
MPDGVSFKIDDREFQRTLRKYVLVSSRTIPDIVNTKAFFIARRAVIETPKVGSQIIREQLKETVIATRHVGPQAGTSDEIPRIIALVQRRGAYLRGISGKMSRAYYLKLLSNAIKEKVGARAKSSAFLKSGWLPAIKILASLVKSTRGAARSDSSVKQVGRSKGTATPARAGFRVRAIIENAANATRDKKDALIKYGGPALQKAFDFERQSMLDYMQKKLSEAAHLVGIITR